MKFLAAFALTAFTLSSYVGAEDKKGEKPIKADVTVKDDDKKGTAKVGQTVEFQVQYPVVPPFPSDFKVTVDGKEMKHEARTTPVQVGGKTVVGAQNQSIYVKFDKPGKKKVVIEWKKGKDDAKKEIEVEVTEK